MTPREKAKELFEKYDSIIEAATDIDDFDKWPFKPSKECALAAVEEILLLNQLHQAPNMLTCYQLQYWQEVKQEIQKL